MLEQGVALELRDSSGLTPLLAAAQGRSPEVVALLLARGADLHARNARGAGALHLAAGGEVRECAGRAELVAQLLAAGCDPGARDERDRTPLHAAAQALRADVALLLIDAGAPVNAVDLDGHSALGLARHPGTRDPERGERRLAVARALIALGAVE
jgi:ankyrin repeat protein